jgi:hypothetical protein
MQDERNPDVDEDAEGVRRLNEDDDEVEAHRTGLRDEDDDDPSRAGRTGLTDEDDDVEAHRMGRLGQSEDPGFRR